MNARIKLVVTAILLFLALALTAFCAGQMVQAFQRFQQERHLVVTGDVRSIRPWMSVTYIAHFYRVPESYLDQSLHITGDKTVQRLPLHELASRVKRSVDSLIHDIQHAILNYRKHPGGGQIHKLQTRAGTSPAPTLYALRGSLRSRVGAGLVPALVHPFVTALTDTAERKRP